jgi:hypothetical protein
VDQIASRISVCYGPGSVAVELALVGESGRSIRVDVRIDQSALKIRMAVEDMSDMRALERSRGELLAGLQQAGLERARIDLLPLREQDQRTRSVLIWDEAAEPPTKPVSPRQQRDRITLLIA